MKDGVVCGFVVVVWFLRKIRPTQLWVELSWVVAKIYRCNIVQLTLIRMPHLLHMCAIFRCITDFQV